MTDSNASQSAKSSTSDVASLLQLPLRHWQKTLAGVLVVVAAAGGYALFGVYQKGQVEKAENELGVILTTKAGAERVAALEGLVKTAPAAMRDGVWLEIAKAAQSLGDFNKAAAAWKSISANAPTGMKTVAGLGDAAALVQAGQQAKAVDVLEGLTVSGNKQFAMLVQRQLAITAEAAGQWQKALTAYEVLKADGHVQNAGFLDARIADLKDKIAKGVKSNG